MSSNKERTEIIARTIKRIRSHSRITDELIKKECRKDNVSVKAIKMIAKGSSNKIVPLTRNEDE